MTDCQNVCSGTCTAQSDGSAVCSTNGAIIPASGIETVTVQGSRNSGSSGFPVPNTAPLEGYVGAIEYFINSALVPLLVGACFIVFLWGVANAYILHPDDETKREEGHKYIMWGIIGFVIIFSVWGLVNLAGTILGLTPGGLSPNPPAIKF